MSFTDKCNLVIFSCLILLCDMKLDDMIDNKTNSTNKKTLCVLDRKRSISIQGRPFVGNVRDNISG
jgi:hypothetical protein